MASIKSLTLDPNIEPSVELLANVAEEVWQRKLAAPSWYDDFALHCLEGKDRVDVFSCCQTVTRWRPKEPDEHGETLDDLWPRRCRNKLWCPLCIQVEEQLRANMAERMLQQSAPKRHAAGYHVVFTLPPFLRPLVRTREGLEAFSRAVERAVAASWGAFKFHDRRAWWRRHAAVWALHPFGDRAEPWPHWARASSSQARTRRGALPGSAPVSATVCRGRRLCLGQCRPSSRASPGGRCARRP
jgi:hypothetical protein